MLTRVISGGQTGVDQGALLAADLAGIKTGGVAPKGWRTEAGPNPGLEAMGLVESDSRNYQPRTRANVGMADGTLIFEAKKSAGSTLTIRECQRLDKPFHVVKVYQRDGKLFTRDFCSTPTLVAAWIVQQRIKVLNVAGHRESVCPGIGAGVERYMAKVFAAL